MKCPKCGFKQADGGVECLKCGVIFAKVRSRDGEKPSAQELSDPSYIPPLPPKVSVTIHDDNSEEMDWEDRKEFARRFLLEELMELPPWAHYARGALGLILVYATLKFIATPIPKIASTLTFFHLVNLPFHEAGHVIFTLFGRFMQVLGGSLLQVLVPLTLMGAFLLTYRDPFAAAVTWWWTGQSLVDLAPYIYDARAGDMMLLGGMTGRENPDIHDWKNLLTWTGLLKYDHALASLAFYTGSAMMISALVWGFIVVYRGLKES